MAVYERTYKLYAGKLTPEWSRFLIIPRHAYRDVFKSKLFTAFFAVCFIPLLVEAILIYLHHNASALAIMKVNVRELLPIDASFFQTFVSLQSGFAFLLAVLIGPPQVSRDLRNNALPLYLCRPFSKAEYVLGKMSIMLILLSAITWIPQLLLFFFQSYLEGFAWFRDNFWIANAIVLASVVWILLLAVISQAVSAIVKWRVVASAALLGIFFIPSVFGEVINVLFLTRWGHIISLGALIKNVTDGLFGSFVRTTGRTSFEDFDGTVRTFVFNEPPLWCSWLALALICAVCLALLSRRIRAYEVVS
jgi:ABC-2 type transport system permease protein